MSKLLTHLDALIQMYVGKLTVYIYIVYSVELTPGFLSTGIVE